MHERSHVAVNVLRDKFGHILHSAFVVDKSLASRLIRSGIVGSLGPQVRPRGDIVHVTIKVAAPQARRKWSHACVVFVIVDDHRREIAHL